MLHQKSALPDTRRIGPAPDADSFAGQVFRLFDTGGARYPNIAVAKNPVRKNRDRGEGKSPLNTVQIIHKGKLAFVEGQRLGHSFVPLARLYALDFDFEIAETCHPRLQERQLGRVARHYHFSHRHTHFRLLFYDSDYQGGP